MKRILLLLICMFCMMTGFAQGMSDKQVIQYIARQHKAGRSQSQIMTGLVQRGVKVDQIRRLRNQYDKQLRDRGITVAADGTVSAPVDRLKANTDDATSQDLNTAKVGTTGTVTQDASEDIEEVKEDVQATSAVNEGTGKKIFGHDIFNNRRLSFEPSMNIATPQN